MSIHNHTDACIKRDSPQDIHASPRDRAPKRSRVEVETQDIDGRPFSIRPHSSEPFSTSRTFTPLCLLPRSRLSLAYLDTSEEGSRLFAAYVHTLEAYAALGDETNVLLVEDADEKTIYAIERVQQRQYALCRLASWADVEDLAGRTTIKPEQQESQRKRQATQSAEDGKPWWASASLYLDAKDCATVRRHRAPTLSMSTMAVSDATRAVQVQTGAQTLAEEAQTFDALQLKAGTAATTGPSHDPLEELSKQYLDSLYLSRLPLAFFVKGPLARARAALTAHPQVLIDFLRTAVLSAPVMDKKFRESIVELIKDLPLLGTPDAGPKPRKKRKWRAKRDKAGFFLDEKDLVEQWWRREDSEAKDDIAGESIEATVRRRAQRLRNRETFLQVILIHEITALEALAMTAPEVLSMNTESQPESKREEQKTRKKKDVDVAATLGTLLDRLCIWYSVESSSPAKICAESEPQVDEEPRDDLKSFAREVIVPFFHSRIPELANATSGKLGGPQAPTPKRKSTSGARRPGEPTTRQMPEKRPRKPLERVSTDTLSRTVKQPPSLHRAATDTDALVPSVKREISETPSLRSIPVTKKGRPEPDKPMPAKRRNLLEQASFGRREVDLSAMSQVNSVKMRKKADVEAKLRDAISTLKKPNRDRATEEIARNADESFAKAIAKSRSGAQGQRRATAHKVASGSAATPGHVKATPATKRLPMEDVTNIDGIAYESLVPSSSARLFAQPGDLPTSSFAVPMTGHRSRHINIEETPSRGFAKFMPPGLSHQPGALQESPVASRSAQIMQTPAHSFKMASLAETPATKQSGLETRTWSPLKAATALKAKSFDLPAKQDSHDTAVGGASIYEAMGWIDDYDELA